MVHGLGKRYVKFRTGKFRPGIAFTICINQLHLAKHDEGLKPVPKMALKKWNSYFQLEYSVRKKQDYLFRPFVVSVNFLLNDPKRRIPFTFQPDFPETFIPFSGVT